MKTQMMLCSIFAWLLMAIAVFAGQNDDKKAVMQVVEEAYVKGVHAQPGGEAMRKGFHVGFIMFILDKGEIRKVTRDEWIARIEKASSQTNGAPQADIKHEFPLVEITGNAAVVKVELYRDGKHIFSDYISLYKFEDGWKLVGKIFYRHPA